MPELPEAERARLRLESVLGRRIAAVDDTDTYVCRPHQPGEIAAALVGHEFASAHRRGKFLWLETEDGPTLGLHLGMAGSIALEAIGMLAFITWVLWSTDGLASPLLNAYLLPVITSALTLGKVFTLLSVALIGACYLFLEGGVEVRELISLPFVGTFFAQLAPVLLVAYITTMFSADIRYGLARAKLLSETDDLTGLLNVRGFAVAANRLFAQAARHGRATSVLMIDSDNLKSVNDSHGHATGNRLLRQLAECIQAELRFTDVAARYGGDEFIVLLPDTPGKGAMEVAERIRNRIASSPLEVDGRRLAMSVSIGIACYPEDGATLDALAAHADGALYAAKQDGRNRSVKFRAAA